MARRPATVGSGGSGENGDGPPHKERDDEQARLPRSSIVLVVEALRRRSPGPRADADRGPGRPGPNRLRLRRPGAARARRARRRHSDHLRVRPGGQHRPARRDGRPGRGRLAQPRGLRALEPECLPRGCPGDFGYGLIDEVTGTCRFAADKSSFSCDAQAGATVYQPTRSSAAHFSTDCASWFSPTSGFVVAEAPAAGVKFFYLMRAVAPNTGSWGALSSGVERTVCP
jgi:hypothetical protein